MLVFFGEDDDGMGDVENEMTSYYKSLYSILQEFDIEINEKT